MVTERKCDNYTPINLQTLADQAGLTIGEVTTFMDEEFGGYAEYIRACHNEQALDEELSRLTSDAGELAGKQDGRP